MYLVISWSMKISVSTLLLMRILKIMHKFTTSLVDSYKKTLW